MDTLASGRSTCVSLLSLGPGVAMDTVHCFGKSHFLTRFLELYTCGAISLKQTMRNQSNGHTCIWKEHLCQLVVIQNEGLQPGEVGIYIYEQRWQHTGTLTHK